MRAPESRCLRSILLRVMRGRIEPGLGEFALDALQKTFEQRDIEGFGEHAHVHMPCPIEFFRITGDEITGSVTSSVLIASARSMPLRAPGI